MHTIMPDDDNRMIDNDLDDNSLNNTSLLLHDGCGEKQMVISSAIYS